MAPWKTITVSLEPEAHRRVDAFVIISHSPQLLGAMGEQTMHNEAFKITLKMHRRRDGGLRVWSDELPELVLSNKDPAKVLEDVGPALEVILSYRLGAEVKVERLSPLPAFGHVEEPAIRRLVRKAAEPKPPLAAWGSMEYAALACA